MEEVLENQEYQEAFRRGTAVNAALFDSMMKGVAKRLQEASMSVEEYREKYDALMKDAAYTEKFYIFDC